MNQENKKYKEPKSQNVENQASYISLAEASELCSYSQEYLSLLARKGLIGAVKMGRNWVITREVLFDYVHHNSLGIKGNHKGQLLGEGTFNERLSNNLLTVSIKQAVLMVREQNQIWLKKGVAWLKDNLPNLSRQAMASLKSILAPVAQTAGLLKNPLIVKRAMATVLLTSLSALSLYVSPVAAKYYADDFKTIAKFAQATIGKSAAAAKNSFNETVKVYSDTLAFVKNPAQFDFKTAQKYLSQGFVNLGFDIANGSVILANNFSEVFLAPTVAKLNSVIPEISELIISPANVRENLLVLSNGDFTKIILEQSDKLSYGLFQPKNTLVEYFASAINTYGELGQRVELLLANKVAPVFLAVRKTVSGEILSLALQDDKVEVTEPKVAGISEVAQLTDTRDNGIATPLATLEARNDGANGLLGKVGQSFISNFKAVGDLGKLVVQSFGSMPSKASAYLAKANNGSVGFDQILYRTGNGFKALADLSFNKFANQLVDIVNLSKVAYQNVFVGRTELVTSKKFLTLEEAQTLLGQISPSVQYIVNSDGKVVGLVGKQGLKGDKGEAGVQGPAGATGLQGERGVDGLGGITGNSVTYQGTTPVYNNTTLFQSINAVDSLAVGKGGIGTGGPLTVGGSSTFGDNSGSDIFTVNSPATINNTLTVAGSNSTVLTGSLDVTGLTRFASNVYVGGMATITAATGAIATRGDLNVLGNTSLTGNLTIGGSLTVGGSQFGATTTLAATGTNTVLTVRQGGTGDLFNAYDGATEVFTILDGGNIGIGTSTPVANLAIQSRGGQTQDLFRIGTTSASYIPTTTDASFFKVAADGGTIIKGGVLNPVWKSQYKNDTYLNSARGVFVLGHYAYVANVNRDSLAIIDVSNPVDPTLIAETQGPIPGTSLDAANDVFVSGNYAYVVGFSKISIIDISNPASPAWLSSTPTQNVGDFAYSIFVAGNYLYAITRDNDSLIIVDVSNPYNPVKLISYKGPVPGTSLDGARSIFVAGKYAYVANYNNDSLAIIDISNPASPVWMAQTQGPVAGTSLNGAHKVMVSGKYAYIANYLNNSLAIINIANPVSPTWVTEIKNDTYLAGARGLFVSGDYAYVANGTRDSLAIIDISSSTRPLLINELRPDGANGKLDSAWGVFVSGNYVYTTSESTKNAISIIDISGLTVSNAEIGSLKVSNLQVENYAQFAQGALIQGGLNVGRSAMFGGPVAINVSTSTSIGVSALKINATSSAALVDFRQYGTGNILSLYSSSTLALSVRNTGQTILSAYPKTSAPSLLIQPYDVSSFNQTTSTMMVINSAASFTGDLLSLQVNGTPKFRVNYQGNAVYNSSAVYGGDVDPALDNAYDIGDLVTTKRWRDVSLYRNLNVGAIDTSDKLVRISSTTIAVYNTDLTIQTNNSQDILLNPSGNRVGIGTSTPSSILSVSTASQAASSTKLFTVASTTGASLFQILANGDVTMSSGNNFDGSVRLKVGQFFIDRLHALPTDLDTSAGLIVTDGAGTFPFDNAGSLLYRTRVTSTTGRSSHLFYTGSPSTEKMRINEIGNVGIGTTTPVGQFSASSTNSIVAVFDQRGTSDILQLRDAGTTVFKVQDGGYVGVGTNTPYSVLSVSTLAQAAPSTKLLTVASTTGESLFQVMANGRIAIGTSTPPTTAKVLISQQSGIFPGGNAILMQGGTDINVGFSLASNGKQWQFSKRIAAENDSFGIFHYNGTSWAGSALTIIPSGNVGFGTTTPAARVQAVATTEQLRLGYNSTNYSSFTVNSSGNLNIASTGGFSGFGTTSPKSVLSVSTPAQQAPTTKLLTVASTTGASLFTVLANGTVGIGMASPSAGLHVQRTTEQLRLGYDSSNYTSFTVSSGGDLTVAPSGGDTNITGNLTVSGMQTFTGASALATTTIMATGTNPVLTVRQGGTGDIVQFKDGNNIVMKILDGGLVGIGTTTPASYLSVSTLSSAAPTTKLFTVASTTGASLFIVRADGKVGLSTSTPTAQFAINTQAGVDPFQIGSSTASYFKVNQKGQALHRAGSLSAPAISFLNDSDTGFYQSSVSEVDLVIDGSMRYQMTSLLFGSVDTGGGVLWRGASSDVQPALTFTADTDTGIGRVAANKLSVITAGASRMVIDSLGKVGIGTSTPYSILSVATSTASAPTTKLLTVASSTGSTLFQVLGSGKIGIGTTSPVANLTVAGSVSGRSFNGNLAAGWGGPWFATGTKDLVGWWPLAKRDSQNGKVSDISGNERHGTITAGASAGFQADWSGRLEAAYDFDGANTKIDTGSDFIGIQAITISAWIYLDSYGEDNFGRIVSNGVINNRFAFYSDGGALKLISGGVEATAGGSTVTLGRWYHVAASRTSDSPALTNIYINGVLTGAANQSSGNPTAGTSNVIIGNNTDQTGAFDGRISNLRIYNRVLSASEVAGLYNDSNSTYSTRVGIGTTTPQSVLSVTTASQFAPTTKLLTVASTTGASLFTVLGGGESGFGTTTPKSRLSVSTNAQQASTYKLFTVASTTGATLFQVMASGQSLFKPLGVSTPVISFVGDENTGFSQAADTIYVVTGGVARFALDTAAIYDAQTSGSDGFRIRKGTGDSSVSNPIYTVGGDQDTGVGWGGANILSLITGGYEAFRLNNQASAVNRLSATSSATGAAVQLGVQGSDTNVSMVIRPQGTGKVGIGTTTPYSLLSIATTDQQAPTYKLLTVASTTGASLFQVLANGKVGIGPTSTPAGLLSVENTGSSHSLVVSDSANDSTPFVIDSSGNVGIGTTAPGYKLQIADTNKTTYGNLDIYTTDAPAIGKGGLISLGGYFTGTTPVLFASIGGRKENNSDGGIGGFLQLNTINTSGVVNERMRITSAGNVGIGTTEPDRKLDILDASASQLRLTHTDGSVFTDIKTDSGGDLVLDPSGNGLTMWDGSSAFDMIIYNANTEAIKFNSNGNSYFNGGNVGIGTTTPSSVLSVSTAAQQAPTYKLLTVASTTGASLFTVLGSGAVGISTTTPAGRLAINATNMIGAVINQAGTSDIFRLNDNGTTVFKVADGGNVGIGTNTPSSVLSVSTLAQAAASTKLLTVASTTGATLFQVMASGKVGLSTSTPTAQLAINTQAGVDPFQIGSSTATYFKVNKNGQTQFAAGSAAAPSMSFVGDTNTGIYNSGVDVLSITANGSAVGNFAGSGGGFYVSNSNGPQIQNAASAATTPRINPNQSDTNTGLGWAGADQLSLVAGGAEIMRLNTVASAVNRLSATSSATGNAVQFGVQGSDTNVSMVIRPQGTGKLGVGTTTPIAFLSVQPAVTLGSTALLRVASNTNATLLTVEATGKVGIGLSNPSAFLHVTGATEQFRLSYNTLNYWSTTINASGTATLLATGTDPGFNFKVRETTALSVNDSQITANVPLQVANSGDVGVAGDIVLSNGTASYITAENPLTIRTYNPSQSVDLTLSAAGNGVIVVDDALEVYGTTTIALTQKSTGAFTIKDREGTTIFNLNDLTTSSLRTFTFGTNDGSVATASGLRIGYGGICVDNDGSCQASTTGRVSARSFGTAASDVAENYPSLEQLQPGDLVMADSNNDGYVVKTTGEYSNNVIGVVSSEPGIVLGSEVEGYPIALVGRIPTKVSNVNGVIRPGDALTVAPTPGYAMKLNDGDTSKVIGTALASFSGTPQETTGLISMFINPDYKSQLNPDSFGLITDGQIATNAAISDLKLGTIRTAGKIALSALPVEIALLQGDTQTFRGNYIFGASADTADLVVLNAKIGSDIKFAIDGLYNIGSSEAAVANIYTHELNSSKLVIADNSEWQNVNADDYGLYLAASSGNAFFGDNIIVGAIHESPVHELSVVLPQYPDFVMNGGDLLVNDDLGIGGNLYVVGDVRIAGALEFAREGIAQMMTVVGAIHESPVPGDIIIVNSSGTTQGRISNFANSNAILGVVGTNSAAVFGASVGAIHESPVQMPVVVSGMAVVNVSAENGPIHRGDKLTTSETAGYAMLATRPGAGVLGLAMEDIAEGQGKIRVLVNLGTYFAPTAQVITVGASGSDFKTITKALNSISDNSLQHRYLIKVAPGIYNEQVTLKDYVDVVGDGENLVTVESGQSPVVVAGAKARLEGLTIKSTSNDDEPSVITLTNGTQETIIKEVIVESESNNPAVGVSINGTVARVMLNNLTFGSNFSQGIVNLASSTVIIMHSDLSQINGTAFTAQNGRIKSYYNNYNGVLGDINVAHGSVFESTGDSYDQVANVGIFLDKTNQGKVDSDYIDYGWLVEETENSELAVGVSSGEGFINGVKVNTSAISNLALSASSTNYIFMTDEGEVTVATSSQSSIIIATVQTNTVAVTSISNERFNEIVVAKQGGQYRTISSALESIISASENNRWTIKVGAGVYNEQVVLKPYVDIVGAGKDNTTIMALNKSVVVSTSDVETQHAVSLPSAGATSTTVVGDSKISGVKLSLAGDTTGQAVVNASSTPLSGASTNLTLEDVNISWSGSEGINGTAVETNGNSNVQIIRLNATGMAYGIVSNVINDGTATSTVQISYSNISTSVADIKTVVAETAGVETQNFVSLQRGANVVSSYNTLSGTGTNFAIATGTIISSAHDTYLTYTGEGTLRQNDYFRNNNNPTASLFNIQNAGINLFNVTASGTIAINPQNTTGDSVVINSATASSTLTVINSGAGTALRVIGNMILTSATSGIPVVLSSAGAQLNVGAPGDTINLNVDGVTYNFKENVRRDTMSAYLSAPISGDHIWGDGNNAWSPAENITVLGVKVQYSCVDSGVIQMVLKDKNNNTIANLNGNDCGGFYKIEENDLEYHLTPDNGLYVDVAAATEGITNVTVTVEFVYDNR